MSPRPAKIMTADQVRANELHRVELALPSHLLVITMAHAEQKGWELRPDMLMRLNRSAAVPLVGLDHFSVARLAKRVDDAAKGIVFGLMNEHPCHPLAVAAQFICLLVAEGLFPDPRNQAVLASLLLLEDLKHEGAEYHYQEKLLMKEAKSWLLRANLQGLYAPLPNPVLMLDSA